jgi:hypothetical protein
LLSELQHDVHVSVDSTRVCTIFFEIQIFKNMKTATIRALEVVVEFKKVFKYENF